MMDEARVKEVFADEAFVKSLLELETPEEVQSALAARGVEASREEILSVRDVLIKAAEKGGALSDEELKNVAGGVLPALADLINVTLPPHIVGIVTPVEPHPSTNGKW
jgi:hypothetical protein